MIPNLVQMVFHVCVGGCDGCLNLNTPDNKGEPSTLQQNHIRELLVALSARVTSESD